MRSMLPFRLMPLFLLLCGSAHAEQNVQMLVPGFKVQELPVKLSNINNLRFAPDGRLTALGYDGRVHWLSDTDGDGLPDKTEPFWDKQTITVPVGMCWAPEGLYISSKGKVSLLIDENRDGKADKEEIVASGWPSTDVGSGGVDATSVTRDKDGNLYFGLLTADYSNPYRVKNGKARYDTNHVRGTIQKWSPQTRTNQTVATGIRVPYNLAFNRAGDLFVTDQEGETWCPGGNPLDELNHIQLGKNYGFPPRHPEHLPNLVSEPPVVGFAPQHQSSCGFTFNESSPQQKRFGPEWWEGDAIVAGQSRGKIWRVRLVKTEHGYMGKEFIIARLSMLTTDVAISPSGDLYVACHSGPPDWGTGPKGSGKLFKITYVDAKAPQPIYTWAENQMEVRVAFDRAIDTSVTSALSGKEIEFGEYVSAADRFEKLKPPYQVVKQQTMTPRGKLKILSATLESDNRILALKTAPHPLLAKYALTIPGIKPSGASGPGETVDVDYDLNGVTVTSATSPQKKSSEWLPHLDFQMVSGILGKSGDQIRKSLAPQKSARSQIQFKLAPPANAVKFRFVAATPIQIVAGGIIFKSTKQTDRTFAIELGREQVKEDQLVSIVIESKPSPVSICYLQENDNSERPLPLSSFRPGWAPNNKPIAYLVPERVELSGGDFQRGKKLFFGEKMKCATCHRIRGEGKTAGPDLSNLAHRDVSSVLRDIQDPNAAINPDYTSFNAHLRNGETLTGFVRAQNENTLQLVGVDGIETNIARSALAELRSSSISLMPEGLLEQASETQIRDLLVFLTSEPANRKRSDIESILKKAGNNQSLTNEPLNIVWTASKQDHGKGEHDYPAMQNLWLGILNRATNVVATNAWEWPSAEQFAQADVLVLYFWNRKWSEERLKQIDEFLARGGGIVALHSATISDKEPEKLAERFGLAAQPVRTKYIHAPVTLKVDFSNAEITRNLPKQLRFLDEPYWPMIGESKNIKPIAVAELDGKAHPQIWTFEKGKGRVFGSIIGHYTWTHEDPLYRVLVLRGIAWAAQIDTRHLEDLALSSMN